MGAWNEKGWVWLLEWNSELSSELQFQLEDTLNVIDETEPEKYISLINFSGNLKMITYSPLNLITCQLNL